MRVPFLIGDGQPMGNDGMRAGRAPCLVNHVDIAPTALGLCGIDVPDWMEGFDYSHHNKRSEMRQLLQSWIEKTGDRFELPKG